MAMDYRRWLLQLAMHLLLLAVRRIQGLLVTDINVPQIVDFRDNVTLSCSYDISGHTLNSVKWYKNDMEFFRYSPLTNPIYMKFPVRGIQLIDEGNECNASFCRVELNLLGINSTGVYRCEVSGDSPNFQLTARAANMSVEALPQNNPLISSFHSIYRFDDFVEANCSTDFSSLLTKLTWYINGVQASSVELHPSEEQQIKAHEYELRRKTSKLNFYANDPRFHQQPLQLQLQHRQQLLPLQMLEQHSNKLPRRQGEASPYLALELRCVAEIENYPQLRRENIQTALLYRNNINLDNQKLTESAAIAWGRGVRGDGFALLLLAALTAAAAAISTRLLTPLTFQYGVRKSTRYKNQMTSSTAAATAAVKINRVFY